MIKAILLFKTIYIYVFKCQCCLHPVIITRQHIGCKNISVSIIVNVSKVSAHGGKTRVLHALLQLVFKCAVFLIDVQIISFVIVIGYIHVWVTVIIHITYGNTQSKTNEGPVNTGLFCYVGKMSVVIAQ